MQQDNKEQIEWEKEFDERFRTGEKAWQPNYIEIKSFITSLLSQVQEQRTKEIAEKIKGMKGEGAKRLNTFIEGHKDGYNKALQDILDSLIN